MMVRRKKCNRYIYIYVCVCMHIIILYIYIIHDKATKIMTNFHTRRAVRHSLHANWRRLRASKKRIERMGVKMGQKKRKGRVTGHMVDICRYVTNRYNLKGISDTNRIKNKGPDRQDTDGHSLASRKLLRAMWLAGHGNHPSGVIIPIPNSFKIQKAAWGFDGVW